MTYYAFSLSDLLNFDKAVANDMTMGEKLENILTTAVGGFILVFVVLALIWGLLELFSVVFVKKKTDKPKTEPIPVAQPEIVLPAEDAADEPADETELVAVITAAITAYRSAEGATTSTGFRVVSFRKK
jgi:sodium pump decarboxylase gamma subunit